MLFEFLHRLVSLDLSWFVWLVTANLVYFFIFLAICFFFWEGKMKKVIAAFFLLCLVAWSWIDFEMISGWVLFVGGFLAIYYITKVAVLAFAENTPALQSKLIIVSEIQFIVALVVYNLFLR